MSGAIAIEQETTLIQPTAMRQLLFKASIGIFVLLLSACGNEPQEETTTSSPSPTPTSSPTSTPTGTASPSPGASPSATETPEAGAEGDKAQPFTQPPTVTEQSDPTAISNLIPPMSQEERVQKVEQEKKRERTAANPFGVVQVPPEPREVAEAPTLPEGEAQAVPNLPDLPRVEPPVGRTAPGTATQVANLPKLPQGEGRQVPELKQLPEAIGAPVPSGSQQVAFGPNGERIAGIPPQEGRGVPDLPELPSSIGPGGPSGGTGEPQIAMIPPQAARGVPDLPELPEAIGPEIPPAPVAEQPAAPPPPDTAIAQGVEVSGVVRVGQETQIIVQAPGEPTTRYVRVGQRIGGNGEVLVKRIERLEGIEPIVILEQNGVEISKAVGEQNVASANESAMKLSPNATAMRP
ncbi:hypothetical protein JJD41_18140 [Oxynema sp. CENA135]|uniref:hypothetical protein n=1 Tax=Oxynema sp. CENA135 TaxID=984206 RepID=UPI00190CC3F3|nr:hypothetical protein [Oxynema sp. CENA135]MBK4731772.1 hypothetical protein [Oxynema sp. CENA135]